MTKQQIKSILPLTLFLVGFVIGILASCFSYTILEIGFYIAICILLPLCYISALFVGETNAGWIALIFVFPLAAVVNGVIFGTMIFLATKIALRHDNEI